MIVREQNRIAQGVDRRLAEDQAAIIGLFLTEPKALGSSRGETREAAVLDLIAAEALTVKMRKYRVFPRVDPYPTGEAVALQ